jgi:flagellar hook-length control protein FliK
MPSGVANARTDGAARGRSSSAGDRADAFGEALDDAQRTPAEGRDQTRVEGERGESADAARRTASRRETNSAPTEKDKSKDKEPNGTVVAPASVVAPVLRPPVADTAPVEGPSDEAPAGVDTVSDASGADLAQAVAPSLEASRQSAAEIVRDATQATAGAAARAQTAPLDAAAEPASKAHGAAAAELSKAASAVASKQVPGDAPVAPPGGPEANAQTAAATSSVAVDASLPRAPKASDQLRAEQIGSAPGATTAERAAARKRAQDLLTQSTTQAEAAEGSPTRSGQANAAAAAPKDNPAAETSATVPPARQAVSVAQRAPVQSGQPPAPDAVVAPAADSSRSHGDASAGQHQPAFDDRRLRDALAAGAARGHAAAQPPGVTVEPQASFARLVDGPAVTRSASVLSPSAAMAAVDEQVIRGIQLQMRDGGGDARIHLRPEHLGDVVVEMRVERDGVVATLRADTPAVRGWLASHQDDLRAGLADVGLHLERLTVSDREAPQEQRRDPSQDEAPRRRRREQVADGRRFEIDA